MALLEERSFTSNVDINCETWVIGVKTVTVVERDGKEIARENHRCLLVPGQDVSKEDERIQAQCAALWTPEIIAAYRASQRAD
tara:strand:+ start:212 stop:460 length:249 start_codon:yes stop_codon:yes gene_type:complete